VSASPISDLGPRLAPILLATAALLWSGNFIAGRALGDSIEALGLNYLRWSLALLILLPLAATEIARSRAAIWASWKYLLALGLTGVAAFQIFVYKALEHTAATNAILVLSTAPAVIVLFSRLALGEPMQGRQWLGIIASFCGAIVLVSHGDLAMLRELELGAGELWMLAAVPTWAVYSVLLKRRPQALPARSMLALSAVVGLAWMTPLVVLSPSVLVVNCTPEIMAGVAYVAVGSSVIAFYCWNRGVMSIGPARAGIYLHLMPVFGSVLAFLLLDETLEGYHLWGAALVFTGIALTQFARRNA